MMGEGVPATFAAGDLAVGLAQTGQQLDADDQLLRRHELGW